jgi:hypothetical protein
MASSFRYDEPARDNTPVNDNPSANVVSLDMITKARLVLGGDYDPTGKSELEILRTVAAQTIGAPKASQKSPEYLRAMLDVACDMVRGSRA